MNIEINSHNKISEVRDDFNKLFPYLKLEFFSKPHVEGEGSWSKFMIFDHTKTLSEISDPPYIGSDILFFTPAMETGNFEQLMQKNFGLSVQVFRKSMGAWIESIQSDNWTLEKQNNKGHESADSVTEMIYTPRLEEES